jgi:sialate O-acetylesterase
MTTIAGRGFADQGGSLFSLKIFRGAIWVVLLAACSARALDGVRPAALFTDHMVLQRGVSTPIWGFADPGERVRVVLGTQIQTAVADSGGRWMVRLDRLDAGGPFEMTVTGKNTATVQDILVGDVWLCSGQSNMDMTVAKEDRTWCGVNNEAEEVAAAQFPLIREFRVRLNMKDEPQRDVEAQWSVCSPATAGRFSATAYFFARESFKRYRVPIGLVVST